MVHLQLNSTARCNDETATVEHQLVIPPDLVEIDQRAVQARGGLAGQLLPQRWFIGIEGGGRQVDHQLGPLRNQLGNRVGPSHPLLLQSVLHPEVLADGQSKPLASGKLQNTGSVTGTEVAPFIENVVTGQQLFASDRSPSQSVHQNDSVLQRRGAVVIRDKSYPY